MKLYYAIRIYPAWMPGRRFVIYQITKAKAKRVKAVVFHSWYDALRGVEECKQYQKMKALLN